MSEWRINPDMDASERARFEADRMTGDVIESLEKELMHAEEYGDNITLIAAQVSVEWKKLRQENAALKEQLKAARQSALAEVAAYLDGEFNEDSSWMREFKRVFGVDGQAAQQQAGGWVSVEERLPADKDRVLTCEKSKRIYTALYSAKHGFIYTCGSAWPEDITHWMPLPPLPTAAEEKD